MRYQLSFSAIIAALLFGSGVAVADGVTAVSVSPGAGQANTNYMIHIDGKGNCDVQIFLARDNPDGFPYSLMANVSGSFPINTPVKSPWPLKAGKYYVEATTLAQNHPGCVLHQKSQTSFTVMAQTMPPINMPGMGMGNQNPPASGGNKPGNKPPQPAPCKHLGKQGVGKDCDQ